MDGERLFAYVFWAMLALMAVALVLEAIITTAQGGA